MTPLVTLKQLGCRRLRTPSKGETGHQVCNMQKSTCGLLMHVNLAYANLSARMPVRKAVRLIRELLDSLLAYRTAEGGELNDRLMAAKSSVLGKRFDEHLQLHLLSLSIMPRTDARPVAI